MDPSQAPTEAPSGRIDPVDVPAPETAPPATLATPNECAAPPAAGAEASSPEAPGPLIEEACVPTTRPLLAVLEAHREAALVPPPPATRPPSAQGPKGIRGSAAFVGVDRLKAAQHEEVLRFRTYAAAGAWRKFHFNHYDWWLVPVHLPSQFGMMWAVCTADIDALLSDAEYVENYREGVYLGALAWGIDLKTGAVVRSPGQSQSWTGHDVRLRKFGISLLLFRQYDLFENLERFVQHLQKQGVSFQTESNMKRGRWPFRR